MEQNEQVQEVGQEKNKMLSDFVKNESPSVGNEQPAQPAQPTQPAQPAQGDAKPVNMGALPQMVSPEEVSVVGGGSKYPTKLKEDDIVVKEFLGRPANFAKKIQTIKSVDIGKEEMQEKYGRIAKAQAEGKQASDDDLNFTQSGIPNIQTNMLIELESGDYIIETKHIKWWFGRDGRSMSPTFNAKITQDTWYDNGGSTAVDRMAFKFMEKYGKELDLGDNFSNVEELAKLLVGKKIQLFERKGSVGSKKFTKLEVHNFED